MRLSKLQDFVKEKGWVHSYKEISGLGSLNFEHKGIRYHVWEFLDGEYGAESNVRTAARQEDFTGDYEQDILDIIKDWT